jgi:Zeta toxin
MGERAGTAARWERHQSRSAGIDGCEGGSTRRSRQMVFVSGAPGAGKTSLAVPLAAELGFALVCKDRLKETLRDALGAPAPDLAWSRTLGAAAMELLWALAADAPPDVRAEYDQPVGIGKLVTVDTATPVDVIAVAAAVRAYLPRPPGQHHGR